MALVSPHVMGRLGSGLMLGFLVGGPFFGFAQTVMPPSGPAGLVNVFNSDLAVLEAGDPRKDLPCTVTPDKAALGFDLRFHTGYDVSIPLSEFAGSDNLLTIVFRVTREDKKSEPVYFSQRVRVPYIDEDAKGEATLQGAFDIGEGNYHVDWLMRDRSERVCSDYWDTEASLGPKDTGMELTIAPGVIQSSEGEEFREEPPVIRTDAQSLNVKVLINFAPQNALSSALQPVDTTALVSILRSIAREPQIGKFSVTAFNMQEQRVVYRQEDANTIDFPALGRALTGLKLGTVTVSQLSEKHSDTEFLAGLIKKEMTAPDHPDALIFAGPKVMLDENVSPDLLKELGDVNFPVFYMNYNRDPQAMPWKDTISRTVKFFRGYEYTISRPRDLWFAVSDLVTRVVKSRNGKTVSAISRQ